MKKSSTLKRKKTPVSQPQSATPDIPKDLSDKWGAVEAISTAFKVIENGSYGYQWLDGAQKSLSFLGALHDQSLQDVLKHPECKKIPQIKEYLEAEEEKKSPEQKLVEKIADGQQRIVAQELADQEAQQAVQ
jgi:hypothetical protein